jgi:CBS domain-containing protein
MKTIGSLVRDRDVYFLASDLTVREAADYMTERRVGAASVLEGTRLVGILSERDIMDGWSRRAWTRTGRGSPT